MGRRHTDCSVLRAAAHLLSFMAAVLGNGSPLPCLTATTPLPGGLRTVSCDRVQLDLIPDSIPADVEVLLLPNNRIAQLSHAAVSRLADSLQEIDLTNNYLEGIPPDLFTNMTKLRKVNLSRNRLRRMPEGFIVAAPYIEELILARNNFRTVPARFLQGMPRLRHLVLADSSIEEIHPEAFTALAATAMTDLDFSSNMLEYIDSAVVPDIFTPTLASIRLHNNFWKCDCKLRWLRSIVDDRKIKWTFDGDTHVPQCEEPKQLKHKSWQLITEDKFGCRPSIAAREQREKRMNFVTGTRMTLTCTFESDPVAAITWEHDGANLDTSWRFTRTVQQNGTITTALLSVPSVTGRDEGTYVCTASSSFGTDNATIIVTVSSGGGFGSNGEESSSSLTIIIVATIGGTVLVTATAAAAYCIRRRILRRGTYLNSKDDGSTMLVQSPSSGSAYPMTLTGNNADYARIDRDDNISADGRTAAVTTKLGGASTITPDIIKLYPEESEPFIHQELPVQLTTQQVPGADPVSEYPQDDAGYREYNAYLALMAEPHAATGTEEERAEALPSSNDIVFLPPLGSADLNAFHLQAAAAPIVPSMVTQPQPKPMVMQQPAHVSMTMSHGLTLNTIPEENQVE